MKIKKILLFIMISIFCFIPVVQAKEEVVVKSINPIDSSDGTVLNSAKKIDVLFNDLGQSTQYKLEIKNSTKRDLYVNSLQIDGSSQNFIKYTLDENSRSKVIKANSEETILINVITKNEKGAGRNLSDNISFKLLLNDKIDNPNTSSNLIGLIILVIMSAVAITFIMTKFNNKKGTIATVIVCFMLLGTSFVFADDAVAVSFTGKVVYNSQNYLETSGTVIENYKANYTSSKDIWAYSNQVKNINISTENNSLATYAHIFDLTINDKQRVKAYLVENGDQNIPYDLYIISNGVIYAPEDATGLFSFPNVETINGLENVIFDNTVKMTGMFIGNEKLNTVDLSTVDTTNVVDTSYMFHKCLSLNVDESKFNLENVEVRNNMFVQYLEDEIIKDAKSDKDLDFSKVSSSTNGEGLYFRSGTEKDNNPIYYYRGNVDNNNVKFAGFCWKIVRTTETGGVKLIYNGISSDNGTCNNTGTATQIGTSKFNTIDATFANYVSYMYDIDVFDSYTLTSISSGKIYGNDIEYRDGKYYLKDTYTSTGSWSSIYNTVGSKYHYTCFSTESSCQTVNYIYYVKSTTAYYIKLKDGQNIDQALNTMLAPNNIINSTIKTVIDNWYSNNMTNYTYKLENTIWCNDKSISEKNGWNKDTLADKNLNLGAYGRNFNVATPSLECKNTNDSFTLSIESGKTQKYGNNSLIYPIGLITADEMILAGASWRQTNNKFYLYNSSTQWTMSPVFIKPELGSLFALDSAGYLGDKTALNALGIRPAISLKSGIDYLSGTGTTTNPYVIE